MTAEMLVIRSTMVVSKLPESSTWDLIVRTVLVKLAEKIVELGKVKKCICRWCWGRLVPNKLSIYYIKCPFWLQTLNLKQLSALSSFKSV